MNGMNKWGALLVVMGLMACGGGIDAESAADDPDPENPDCAAPAWPGDAAFEVGTGASCFSPLADGAQVPLIGGPQGGYHLWLGVRCRGCERNESVTYGVRDPETGDFLWGASQGGYLTFDDAGDYRQVAGLTALVPGDEWSEEPGVGTDFVGQDLALFAEVTLAGVAHSSEVTVHVGSIEYQASSCPECN